MDEIVTISRISLYFARTRADSRRTQADLPPLFIIGADGGTEHVNTRVHANVLIVDSLFEAAELRLGGRNQRRVRILRLDGRRGR